MTLDFQQIREQVKALGEKAPAREQELRELYDLAYNVFHANANEVEYLRQRVKQVVDQFDPFVRCALPVAESLDSHFPPPDLPREATILAADGSQISPDRHAAVDFCLINVGAVKMRLGVVEPPSLSVSSRLFYDLDLYTPGGLMTDASLALMRDFNERKMLAELASGSPPPVITFTDGQMELWGRFGEGLAAAEFQKHLDQYLQVLKHLCKLDVISAGYVDKPAANHVIRLLEAALLPETELPKFRESFPLRGVKDLNIFSALLAPGERSAIFELQSRSASYYRNSLSLHFFYLNVGRDDRPWLARVEFPAWVAEHENKINYLHAVLIDQCRIVGSRPYPYLLHRAHELALVSLEEKRQVENMITLELHQQGLAIGEISQKKALKEGARKKRYLR
ncbi:MAG: DNA double-strand break repair nuclease NurA [Anaerolineales bacterium]|nr:DNA double-strand break repair nuclease NurA [Anaerolineales bacterium]